MKQGQYVRITKVAARPDAVVPTAAPENYVYGEENSLSLPVEYTATGTLVANVVVGRGARLLRDTRNGVACPGMLITSEVTEILSNGFKTLNSVYVVENITRASESH